MSTQRTHDWRWFLLLLAALIIVLDRVSKRWIEAHIQLGGSIVVWPHVFRLTHVLNTGAAFSMFEGGHSQLLVRYGLIAFSAIAIVVVLVLLFRYGRALSATGIAFALILGGAAGNLYDRIVYHHVVDFLEVHIVRYHWPDFNVADSAIVVGACLLLLEMLRPQKDV